MKRIFSVLVFMALLVAAVCGFAADQAVAAVPATYDFTKIMLGVAAALGWLYAGASELMPFLPGPAQGVLHGWIELFKTPKYDAATGTLSVQIDALKKAINDIKGTSR
jgi:hypothetical protein